MSKLRSCVGLTNRLLKYGRLHSASRDLPRDLTRDTSARTYTSLTTLHTPPSFHYQQSPSFHYQQSAGKKTKAKKTKGGGGAPGGVNKQLLINHVDCVDMMEINGRMMSELNLLAQSLMMINISSNSNPAVLASVNVRIGVEGIAVTDICNIVAEPGQPIILDCSLYSEYRDRVLEAVRQGTTFEAELHGNDSIKLIAPKLTNQLRKKLISQANEQKNVAIENVRKIRNATDSIVKGSKTDDKKQRLAQKNIHELFLHYKDESGKIVKVKERNLQQEFDL